MNFIFEKINNLFIYDKNFLLRLTFRSHFGLISDKLKLSFSMSQSFLRVFLQLNNSFAPSKFNIFFTECLFFDALTHVIVFFFYTINRLYV